MGQPPSACASCDCPCIAAAAAAAAARLDSRAAEEGEQLRQHRERRHRRRRRRFIRSRWSTPSRPFGSSLFEFRVPSAEAAAFEERLGARCGEVNLRPLLRHLQPANVVKLLSAALLERSILVLSPARRLRVAPPRSTSNSCGGGGGGGGGEGEGKERKRAAVH